MFALDPTFRRVGVNTDSIEIAIEINQEISRRSDDLEMLKNIRSPVE